MANGGKDDQDRDQDRPRPNGRPHFEEDLFSTYTQGVVDEWDRQAQAAHNAEHDQGEQVLDHYRADLGHGCTILWRLPKANKPYDERYEYSRPHYGGYVFAERQGRAVLSSPACRASLYRDWGCDWSEALLLMLDDRSSPRWTPKSARAIASERSACWDNARTVTRRRRLEIRPRHAAQPPAFAPDEETCQAVCKTQVDEVIIAPNGSNETSHSLHGSNGRGYLPSPSPTPPLSPTQSVGPQISPNDLSSTPSVPFTTASSTDEESSRYYSSNVQRLGRTLSIHRQNLRSQIQEELRDEPQRRPSLSPSRRHTVDSLHSYQRSMQALHGAQFDGAAFAEAIRMQGLDQRLPAFRSQLERLSRVSRQSRSLRPPPTPPMTRDSSSPGNIFPENASPEEIRMRPPFPTSPLRERTNSFSRLDATPNTLQVSHLDRAIASASAALDAMGEESSASSQAPTSPPPRLGSLYQMSPLSTLYPVLPLQHPDVVNVERRTGGISSQEPEVTVTPMDDSEHELSSDTDLNADTVEEEARATSPVEPTLRLVRTEIAPGIRMVKLESTIPETGNDQECDEPKQGQKRPDSPTLGNENAWIPEGVPGPSDPHLRSSSRAFDEKDFSGFTETPPRTTTDLRTVSDHELYGLARRMTIEAYESEAEDKRGILQELAAETRRRAADAGSPDGSWSLAGGTASDLDTGVEPSAVDTSSRSPLPLNISNLSLHETAVAAGFDFESAYVRQQSFDGGITGPLLSPSQAENSNGDRSSSTSEGIMMAPTPKLRSDASVHAESAVRDSARGRTHARLPSPSPVRDSSGSDILRRREEHESDAEQQAIGQLRAYAFIGERIALCRMRQYDAVHTSDLRCTFNVLDPSRPFIMISPMPHVLPPTFARRALRLVEDGRRTRFHEGALLLRPTGQDAAWLEVTAPSITGWQASTLDDLLQHDELESVGEGTRRFARVLTRRWSTPPSAPTIRRYVPLGQQRVVVEQNSTSAAPARTTTEQRTTESTPTGDTQQPTPPIEQLSPELRARAALQWEQSRAREREERKESAQSNRLMPFDEFQAELQRIQETFYPRQSMPDSVRDLMPYVLSPAVSDGIVGELRRMFYPPATEPEPQQGAAMPSRVKSQDRAESQEHNDDQDEDHQEAEPPVSLEPRQLLWAPLVPLQTPEGTWSRRGFVPRRLDWDQVYRPRAAGDPRETSPFWWRARRDDTEVVPERNASIGISPTDLAPGETAPAEARSGMNASIAVSPTTSVPRERVVFAQPITMKKEPPATGSPNATASAEQQDHVPTSREDVDTADTASSPLEAEAEPVRSRSMASRLMSWAQVVARAHSPAAQAARPASTPDALRDSVSHENEGTASSVGLKGKERERRQDSLEEGGEHARL